MIVITGYNSATAKDVLNGTRLSSIPYEGELVFEMLADAVSDAGTNYAQATIQLPSGDVPINNQRIHSAREGIGTLNDDDETLFSFSAENGGHFFLDFNINGTIGVAWRITLTP